MAMKMTREWELLEQFSGLSITPVEDGSWVCCAHLEVRSDLVEQSRARQSGDRLLSLIMADMVRFAFHGYSQRGDGLLLYRGRICVPEDAELRQSILSEAHRSCYTIHPGVTKMYHTLRQYYWWDGLRRDIAAFVALCSVCQQIKAEHQRPAGFL